MKYIEKSDSPNDFEQWKEQHTPKLWSELQGNLPPIHESTVFYYSKQQLREALLSEQFKKCIYCERKIENSVKSKIDHVRVPRSKCIGHYEFELFNYKNLGLCCDGGERIKNGIEGNMNDGQNHLNSKVKLERLHCDASKREKNLPFTPYDQECEIKITFNENGQAYGLDNDADEVIRILNLNLAKLKNVREAAIEGYILASPKGEYISIDDAKELYLKIKNRQDIPHQKAILDCLKRLF